MDVLGTTAPESDPTLERVMTEAVARRTTGLDRREWMIGGLSALGFLAVAVAMPLVLDPVHSLKPGLALALVATYALADRVAFRMGAVWVVPTEIVLVPMLFLLPPAAVPLLVTAALVVDRLPEFMRGKIHPSRVLLMAGDGWFAVGPALVFAFAGLADPSWSDWPYYVLALASQMLLSLGQMAVGAATGGDLRTDTLLKEARSVWMVDAMLSPIGLLVAFACVGQPWSFLAVLPLLALIRSFAREREARIENALVLSSAYRGTAHLMAELLATSDEYTGSHSRSVVLLAHQVGDALGLDAVTMRDVEFGALLHDIGKMTVPSAIINKPGKLTEEEWDLMRAHTAEGERMLERIGGMLADVGRIVRSHHEHFDGSGYPDGLRGEQIPLASRVIAACDAFNAMTTNRSYRSAMSSADAVEELRRHSGSQFDPLIVEVLVEIVEHWEPASTVMPEALTRVFGRRREREYA